MNEKPLVVAAIPAYEEEATIAKVILLAKPFVDSIIVCDDGSKDMTGEIAKSLGVTVLTHAKNMGKGWTIRALFDKARRLGADMTVTIDADMQHDPRDIPRLLQAMRTTHADVVIGSRFIKDSKTKAKVPRRRAVGNKVLTALTDRNITDTQSGYRVYSKRALNCLKPTEMGMGVDSELIMKAEEKKLKIIEVPIKVRYDVPKPSKQGSVSHGGGVVLSVIRRLSIRRPLSFYGLPGAISLLFALFFWIWSIQSFSTTRQLITNVTLLAIATTLVGLMLLTTAIILWVLVGVVLEARDTERQSR